MRDRVEVHTTRWRASANGIALAILLTLAAASAMPSPALASSGWTVEPSSNPSGASSSYLQSVSCTSSSDCTAVGYQYDTTEQNLAESYSPSVAPPTVTNLNPSSGPAAGGTVVTITGTGFTGATAVDFGTAAATNVTVNSATQITATSPAGTGGSTVDVTVIGPNGTSAIGSPDRYTYLSPGPPPQETLTVTTGGTGSGSVTGSGISCPGTCTTTYSQGTIVTLTATPASGSAFGGWSGACSGTGTCTVTMSAAESVTATFTSTATAADLATTLTYSGIATVGGYMGFTTTVTNTGPNTASNLVMTENTPSGSTSQPTTFYCVGSPTKGSGWCGQLPHNVSCSTPPVGSPGTVTCKTGTLSPGASVTLIIAVQVGFYLHNQAICDTATANSGTFDPNTANNTATVCARVN